MEERRKAMASQMSPTAANIISSLGIKGATVSDALAGYVPILGPDGKLSANFIPANAAQDALPALSNVAYVDPYTEVEDGLRKGSAVAPFKSISEAASNFEPTEYASRAAYIAFVLAPGDYGDSLVAFGGTVRPLDVYIIGLGRCRLSSNMTISGMASSESSAGRSQSVILQNIVANGMVGVAGNPIVTCLGDTYVGTLTLGNTESTAGELRLGSEARVSSTNAAVVSYLSEDDRIGNTSSVPGKTVKDAVSRIGKRKIRIAKITQGIAGFDIASSCSDVTAESSGSTDIYDLSKRDRLFAECVNSILENGKFENIRAGTVAATNVTADSISVKTLRMDALSLGGYRLEIDTYGYLVVADGSAPTPAPPDSVVMLRDVSTGASYILVVSKGRLYLRDAEGSDSSSSDSSSSDQYVLYVYDPDAGKEYALYVDNGRLMIEGAV